MRFLIRQKAGLCGLVFLFIGSCLCWMPLPEQARAATGIIADDAHVLDITAIHQYTDPFSSTVDIFTAEVFQGSNNDFDASVKGLTSDSTIPAGSFCDPKHQVGCDLFDSVTMPGAPNTTSAASPVSTADTSGATGFMWRRSSAYQSVEIGIDVPARHLAIFSGKSVTIEQDHYDSAIRAFADTMHQTHDNYTQATIAALNALQSASDRFWDGVRAAVPWVLLVVLVVGAIIYFNGAGNQGETSTSSGGSSYRRHTYDSWNSGGGGGSSSGGTGDDSGGGGGGASGNF